MYAASAADVHSSQRMSPNIFAAHLNFYSAAAIIRPHFFSLFHFLKSDMEIAIKCTEHIYAPRGINLLNFNEPFRHVRQNCCHGAVEADY